LIKSFECLVLSVEWGVSVHDSANAGRSDLEVWGEFLMINDKCGMKPSG
jgi:hypothetical protein